MVQAKTPHFMQMHSGALDAAKLQAFAAQNPVIEAYQALEFLNIDGAQIVFEGGSLAGSVQDNGFTVQSEKFDYLLDLDGNIIQVADGEVYVPLNYWQDGRVEVGDTLLAAGKTFRVTGFHRDLQMNSAAGLLQTFFGDRKGLRRTSPAWQPGISDRISPQRPGYIRSLRSCLHFRRPGSQRADDHLSLIQNDERPLRRADDRCPVADQRPGRCDRLPLHPLHFARQNRGRLPRNWRVESHRFAGDRHPKNLSGEICCACRSGQLARVRAFVCVSWPVAGEYPPVFWRERKRGPGPASGEFSACCWSFSPFWPMSTGC